METKKVALTDSSLRVVSSNVAWHVVPAKGDFWGILVGLTESTFSMLSCRNYEFGTAIMVKNNVDDFVWRLVVIYGPFMMKRKWSFLKNCILSWRGGKAPQFWEGTLI
jgi:hypothetical protein